MKKTETGFNGYVYDFSVDYDVTDIDDIKDKHLIKKKRIQYNKYVRTCLNTIVANQHMKMPVFIKKVFYIAFNLFKN